MNIQFKSKKDAPRPSIPMLFLGSWAELNGKGKPWLGPDKPPMGLWVAPGSLQGEKERASARLS